MLLKATIRFAVIRPPGPLQVTCGLVDVSTAVPGAYRLQVIDPDLTGAVKRSLYTRFGLHR